jgi:hypothetical protein
VIGLFLLFFYQISFGRKRFVESRVFTVLNPFFSGQRFGLFRRIRRYKISRFRKCDTVVAV